MRKHDYMSKQSDKKTTQNVTIRQVPCRVWRALKVDAALQDRALSEIAIEALEEYLKRKGVH